MSKPRLAIRPLLGTAALGLLLCLAAGGAAAEAADTVPRVVGLKLPAALALLKQHHLEAKPVAEESWFPGEDQVVFRQLPREGPLPGGAGRVVTVWYHRYRFNPPSEPAADAADAAPAASARPALPGQEPGKDPLVAMPLLLGLDRAQAVMTAEAAGLVLGVSGLQPTTNRFLADKVTEQNPRPGVPVARGSLVTVEILAYRPRPDALADPRQPGLPGSPRRKTPLAAPETSPEGSSAPLPVPSAVPRLPGQP